MCITSLGIPKRIKQTIENSEYTYLGTIDTRCVPQVEHARWHDKFHTTVYFRGYSVMLIDDTTKAQHEEFDVWVVLPDALSVPQTKFYRKWLEFTKCFRTFTYGNS